MTPLRQRMTEDMQLAGYSSKTQQAYVGAVRQLFAHFKCNPSQLTEEQLRRYFLYLANERRVSRPTATIESRGVPCSETVPEIAPAPVVVAGRYVRVVLSPSATVPPLESATVPCVPREAARSVPEHTASELRRAKRPNRLSFIVLCNRASSTPLETRRYSVRISSRW